ncbi:hypothetical protein EYF80_026039 [Liparis tanakae]|uniref:Uncharacterized protein n=1 Tax=Liparis tanakae TaxID=230148 RepID=A0A4Z2HFX9_9TELE|nr:hypothetical protein EYF80_026039 [Liparis tanakae]
MQSWYGISTGYRLPRAQSELTGGDHAVLVKWERQTESSLTDIASDQYYSLEEEEEEEEEEDNQVQERGGRGGE